MSETIWTNTITPLIDPLYGGSATTAVAPSGYWEDTWHDTNIPAITTLEAKTRVNGTTFASKDIETIKEIVKDKLYKQLLQQLMTSGCVKIESVKNPTNQSVTFTARIELVKPKALDDETLKAA